MLFILILLIFSMVELKYCNRFRVYGKSEMRNFPFCLKRWRNWRINLSPSRSVMFWGCEEFILLNLVSTVIQTYVSIAIIHPRGSGLSTCWTKLISENMLMFLLLKDLNSEADVQANLAISLPGCAFWTFLFFIADICCRNLSISNDMA